MILLWKILLLTAPIISNFNIAIGAPLFHQQTSLTLYDDVLKQCPNSKDNKDIEFFKLCGLDKQGTEKSEHTLLCSLFYKSFVNSCNHITAEEVSLDGSDKLIKDYCFEKKILPKDIGYRKSLNDLFNGDIKCETCLDFNYVRRVCSLILSYSKLSLNINLSSSLKNNPSNANLDSNYALQDPSDDVSSNDDTIMKQDKKKVTSNINENPTLKQAKRTETTHINKNVGEANLKLAELSSQKTKTLQKNSNNGHEEPINKKQLQELSTAKLNLGKEANGIPESERIQNEKNEANLKLTKLSSQETNTLQKNSNNGHEEPIDKKQFQELSTAKLNVGKETNGVPESERIQIEKNEDGSNVKAFNKIVTPPNTLNAEPKDSVIENIINKSNKQLTENRNGQPNTKSEETTPLQKHDKEYDTEVVGEKEEDDDQDILKKPYNVDESISDITELESGSSYFFPYFLLICLFVIVGYVVYHNKQKVLALLLEGRKNKTQYRGRRPNSANYHKLDSNLEEAISSSCSKNSSNVIY